MRANLVLSRHNGDSKWRGSTKALAERNTSNAQVKPGNEAGNRATVPRAPHTLRLAKPPAGALGDPVVNLSNSALSSSFKVSTNCHSHRTSGEVQLNPRYWERGEERGSGHQCPVAAAWHAVEVAMASLSATPTLVCPLQSSTSITGTPQSKRENSSGVKT